jgi:hypothetical protein
MRPVVTFAACVPMLAASIVVVGCVVAPLRPPEGGGANDTKCGVVRERLIANARGVASAFATGCRTKDDCRLVSATIACQESCPVAVLAAKESQFAAALKRFDAANCSAPILTQCGADPLCAASMSAPVAYEAGSCVVAVPSATPVKRKDVKPPEATDDAG